MISHTHEKQLGAIHEIIKSLESGEIDETTIDQSIKRIDTLKEKYLSWADLSLDRNQDVPEIVGSKLHEETAYEVYKESVTIVKNEGILPLAANEDRRILVIHSDNGTTMQVEDKRYASLSLAEAIREYHPKAEVHQFSKVLTNEEIETILEKARQYDTIIVGTLTILPGSNQITLIERMVEEGKSIIVVAMRNPYDLAYIPEVPAYINTYEFTYPALRVAAGAIFGLVEVRGKLPVSIKTF